jgi:hypothetical protein
MPSDWNRADWTLAIAVVSLVVSILVSVVPPLYRRFWQRPSLRFHRAGYIQVHFGPFGPGLMLAGSIQAVNCQQFLAVVDAVVRHEATKEERTFVWRILYPDPFNHEPGKPAKTDLPAGAMVNPQQAYRFNAFFSDPGIEEGPIRQIIDRFQHEWTDIIGQLLATMQDQPPEVIAQLSAQADRMRQVVFSDFARTQAYAEARETLSACFSWKPGTYSLVVRTRTAEPDNAFESRWRFEITEDCVQKLRWNTDLALAELAGLPHPIYNGCTVDYLDPA